MSRARRFTFSERLMKKERRKRRLRSLSVLTLIVLGCATASSHSNDSINTDSINTTQVSYTAKEENIAPKSSSLESRAMLSISSKEWAPREDESPPKEAKPALKSFLGEYSEVAKLGESKPGKLPQNTSKKVLALSQERVFQEERSIDVRESNGIPEMLEKTNVPGSSENSKSDFVPSGPANDRQDYIKHAPASKVGAKSSGGDLLAKRTQAAPSRVEVVKRRANFSLSGTPAFSLGANFFSALDSGEAVLLDGGLRYELTIDPGLQKLSQNLLKKHKVPWGTIVAVEPKTGRVLVLAGHSEQDKSRSGRLAVSSGFPAASLFKVITASAAVENSGFKGNTPIFFRGGNYTLNRHNYTPNSRLDRRKMDLASALGKSCNPAFGRVGLNQLSSEELTRFAFSFGFNQVIPFEVPVEMSSFSAPETDYEIARTSAGFGPAYVSPLHTALLAATVANGGTMMRPQLVSEVRDSENRLLYQSRPRVLRHVLLENTADSVLNMMEATVEQGTARKYFALWQRGDLGRIRVAAKTGTLSGKNPKGVYHWFIAAAPIEAPQIAASCLVIDPGNARVRATALCREMLEQFFRHSAPEKYIVRSTKKSTSKSLS